MPSEGNKGLDEDLKLQAGFIGHSSIGLGSIFRPESTTLTVQPGAAGLQLQAQFTCVQRGTTSLSGQGILVRI